MRIGIDAKRLFFNYTGLGNYGRQFVHALVSGLDTTDETLLFCPKSIENSQYSKEFKSGNIQIKTPGGFKNWFGGALWRTFFLPKDLSANHVDVFYGISNELPFGIHKLNLKKVVIIHDLIFLRFPEHYPALDVFFYKIKTKYAAKIADKIIAVSEQTKQDLIDFYAVSKDKIIVVPPVCDEIYYSDENRNSKNIYQEIKRPYCLNVGSITPRKNLLLVVEAYSRIANKLDIDLVVVGTAVGAGKVYLEKIKDYIRDKKLENQVLFLGKVDKNELPDIYRNAKFMAYPSQFEGFGMPIAESLFCKTPVITSKGGCFAEAGGAGAIYIDPNNLDELAQAMEKLSTDEKRCRQLAEAGFAHVQQFKTSRIAERIIDFHKKLVADLPKQKSATR